VEIDLPDIFGEPQHAILAFQRANHWLRCQVECP
jgi:hypothetical protein